MAFTFENNLKHYTYDHNVHNKKNIKATAIEYCKKTALKGSTLCKNYAYVSILTVSACVDVISLTIFSGHFPPIVRVIWLVRLSVFILKNVDEKIKPRTKTQENKKITRYK